MNYKGRYYLEDPCQQSDGRFEQNSIYFNKARVKDSYVDASDPEKLIQCPYDKNHKIRACRFPYHLVKCGKNHPDVVKQLVTCPFNARHQIPKEEISQHISSCDDKRCIEQDIASQVDNRRKEVNVSSWQSPPCEEDWDKDLASQSHSVFVWGTNHHATTSTNTTLACRSHLNASLRAPRTLPCILPWKKNAGN